VMGFLINKFRGDRSLLEPAIKSVEKITRKKILGVIPKVDFDLPDEDSVDGKNSNKSDLPKESWDWQIDLLAKAIKDSIDTEEIMAKIIELNKV
jgi:adenosylcobyric acid synthase